MILLKSLSFKSRFKKLVCVSFFEELDFHYSHYTVFVPEGDLCISLFGYLVYVLLVV